jgi:ATP-dependent Clp protease ATP-binding subunit ClpB
MTSNLGSDVIRDRMEKWNNKIPEKEEERLREDIFTLLRKTLKPEFLNRVDEIVMFKPLTKDQIKEIVKIQLGNLEKTLAGYNLKLVVNDEVLEWLADKGYDPQLGARPVKRLIQKEIVNELSKEIIGGKVSKEDVILTEIKNDHLSFKRATKKSEVN